VGGRRAGRTSIERCVTVVGLFDGVVGTEVVGCGVGGTGGFVVWGRSGAVALVMMECCVVRRVVMVLVMWLWWWSTGSIGIGVVVWHVVAVVCGLSHASWVRWPVVGVRRWDEVGHGQTLEFEAGWVHHASVVGLVLIV
jgi:hypothetical protein